MSAPRSLASTKDRRSAASPECGKRASLAPPALLSLAAAAAIGGCASAELRPRPRDADGPPWVAEAERRSVAALTLRCYESAPLEDIVDDRGLFTKNFSECMTRAIYAIERERKRILVAAKSACVATGTSCCLERVADDGTGGRDEEAYCNAVCAKELGRQPAPLGYCRPAVVRDTSRFERDRATTDAVMSIAARCASDPAAARECRTLVTGIEKLRCEKKCEGITSQRSFAAIVAGCAAAHAAETKARCGGPDLEALGYTSADCIRECGLERARRSQPASP